MRPSTVKTESEPPASEDQPAPSRRRPGREESARPKVKARTAAKSRSRAQEEHRAEVPANSVGGAPSEGGSSAQTSVIRDLLRDQSKRSQDRGKTSISQVKLETFKGRREHFKDWKKTLEAQRLLYRLSDEELAMLKLHWRQLSLN